jgi:hypothetical protein
MSQLHEAWLEKQRLRWMQCNPERFLRPDAHRFIRPDAYRYFKPGAAVDLGQQPHDRKDSAALARESADAAACDRQAEFDASGVRWHLAALRVELALIRFEQWRRKAGFNPDQPRVPAGNPGGGQWTSEGWAANQTVLQLAGPVPTDDPPEIPSERPSDPQQRNSIVRSVARWLGKYGGTVGKIAGAAYWLYEYDAEIAASLDPPRSLEDLQQAAAMPKAGYQRHHIVEQTPAEQDGYSRTLIDGPENLVRIPTLKHREITSWYQAKNETFGFRSPREYLQGKSWDERRRVGIQALIDAGVLEP